MGTGPAANAMNHVDKVIVEETIKKAFSPYHVVDNFYFLLNHFLLFIAQK